MYECFVLDWINGNNSTWSWLKNQPFYTKVWQASNFPNNITPESSISGHTNKGNDQQVKELY